jgi:hypothetical protein
VKIAGATTLILRNSPPKICNQRRRFVLLVFIFFILPYFGDSNAFILGSLELLYATVLDFASGEQPRRKCTSASLAAACRWASASTP